MQAAEEQREENAFFPVTRQLVIEWPKYGSKSNHEGDPGAPKGRFEKATKATNVCMGVHFLWDTHACTRVHAAPCEHEMRALS